MDLRAPETRWQQEENVMAMTETTLWPQDTDQCENIVHVITTY